MAISLKDLRKKIKSVQGTRKLTQAMQMIAASKMQKAIKAAETSRNYSNLAWEIIQNIRGKTELSTHNLLSERKVNKVAIVLSTSNRGMCGAFNSQIIKKTFSYIKEMKDKNINVKLITVGNKGKLFAARYFKEILVADFPAFDKVTEFIDVLPVANMLISDYQAEKYDQVHLFYNHFVSTLKQEPTQRQILPIPNIETLDARQQTLEKKQETESDKLLSSNVYRLTSSEYKFEPDTDSILDILLPQVIKTQIHQIFLESNASEQSARMMAMKNATDNASDMIDDLTLTYNGLRQAAITREISEISAGAEALRS